MEITPNHLTMRHLPSDDQPYEKLMNQGAQALSDAELLAVIIRSGNRAESALTVCQRLLSDRNEKNGCGLLAIADKSLEELTARPGIGKVKAVQMKAAIEIGYRAALASRTSNRQLIRSPEDAFLLLDLEMRNLPREELRIILLDVRNKVIRISRISEGGLTASVVFPRDLFREAVKANAAGVILAHNHPSGDATPSREDLETTRRLTEAGEMMCIRIIDHLILAAGGSISLKQHGLI